MAHRLSLLGASRQQKPTDNTNKDESPHGNARVCIPFQSKRKLGNTVAQAISKVKLLTFWRVAQPRPAVLPSNRLFRLVPRQSRPAVRARPQLSFVGISQQGEGL
jgi:hypothetical protein